MVNVYCSVTGVFLENTYFLVNESALSGVIVDPGNGALAHLKALNKPNITWEAIFITHAHFDHIMGVSEVSGYTKAPIYLHKSDLDLYLGLADYAKKFKYEIKSPSSPSVFWKHNDIITLKTADFNVIHTPGHTAGSVCIQWEGGVFTGDTLLKSSIGKTESLESFEDLKKSITQKLLHLPDEMIIYPGHFRSCTINKVKIDNSEVVF